MGYSRLTPEDIDKLAQLFVMAVTQGAPVHRDKDGNGPKHCPCVIWEDSLHLDAEAMPPMNHAKPKHNDS